MKPQFLIASPQMRDPFFERTVVLLWHHDESGAIGVVVNKLLDHTLGEVLEEELAPGQQHRSDPVGWGGPVERTSGTVVTRGTIDEDEGWLLDGGVNVTRSSSALKRLLGEDVPMLLLLGYAGWGPGQLDAEIERGGWLWTDCEAGLIFDTPSEQRYDAALATRGLNVGNVWMTPIDE